MQLVVPEGALLHLAVGVRNLALAVQHVLLETALSDDAARIDNLCGAVE